VDELEKGTMKRVDQIRDAFLSEFSCPAHQLQTLTPHRSPSWGGSLELQTIIE
jgi:hypothetical protein